MFRHFSKFLLSRGAFVFSSSKPHNLKHVQTSIVLCVGGIDQIKRLAAFTFYIYVSLHSLICGFFGWTLMFIITMLQNLTKLYALQYSISSTDKICCMAIHLLLHIMGWDFLSDRRCNSQAIKCVICHIKLTKNVAVCILSFVDHIAQHIFANGLSENLVCNNIIYLTS